jgi:hypothetical protein
MDSGFGRRRFRKVILLGWVDEEAVPSNEMMCCAEVRHEDDAPPRHRGGYNRLRACATVKFQLNPT